MPCVSEQPETKRLVLTAGLNHLFTERYFSICKLDALMDVVGTGQKSDAYRLLRTLHCVDYSAMPADLLDRLPHLVNECLSRKSVAHAATEAALEGVEL